MSTKYMGELYPASDIPTEEALAQFAYKVVCRRISNI